MRKGAGLCEVRKCRRVGDGPMFYGKEVCARHWNMYCGRRINLKKEFGVEE